jgi:hypothetical protein
LPLREVGVLDWGHSVRLLPFTEGVHVRLRVEAHHLSLHAHNVGVHEGGLHVRLVDCVEVSHKFGLINVACAELRPDEIMLALAKRSQMSRIFGLIVIVSSKAKVFHGVGKAGSSDNEDRAEGLAFPADIVLSSRGGDSESSEQFSCHIKYSYEK